MCHRHPISTKVLLHNVITDICHRLIVLSNVICTDNMPGCSGKMIPTIVSLAIPFNIQETYVYG